jgi:hypothetical protein
MKRVKMLVGVLVGVTVLSAVVAVGQLNPNPTNEWPFGDDPRDAFHYTPPGDFVMSVGITAAVPGSEIIMGLGTAFRIDPFFTNGQTDIAVLPTFAASQSLETGLEFNWWSASVDVGLSLAPWALVSTGGWLELHPPAWTLADNPIVTLTGGVGWGPQWAPVGGWSHAIGGTLDARADWSLPTLWDSMFNLAAESDLGATWTFPDGLFVTDWLVMVDARFMLPSFQDSPAALRAGVVAQVFVLPTFAFGFDISLEFRANAFYAYGLVGAGVGGIRAEVGAELAIGMTTYNRSVEPSEQN